MTALGCRARSGYRASTAARLETLGWITASTRRTICDQYQRSSLVSRDSWGRTLWAVHTILAP